ncbi:MAG TPA: protein-L-isoaspartate O-methyltransferase [Alphaproteobacteria bacterium]|jgi:protein-L-isoaspartate(D-aspartate) O-methyltransferase|nr:protein-L-isoaspartate O-methyltransferase [Alphaproteobacteria bacterium]
MMDYAAARQNMVESQLRPAGISEATLLRAAAEIPREIFLEPEVRSTAYSEAAVCIAPGRFMLSPLSACWLLQGASIGQNEVVLVVGAGDGYMAALAAKLASTVIGLECDSALAARAALLFTQLGLDNIAMIEGELAAGDARQAPFDVIIVNGAVEAGLDPLTAQLSDGGRLVCVENENGAGQARLYRRDGDSVSSRPIRNISAPLLTGFAKAKAFSF